MKVVSYYNVVPKKNKSQEKYDILTKFPQGVRKLGDDGLLHTADNIVDCDVAVIQGWQHERGKTAPHLKLRQAVIDNQLRKQKYVCTADANLFLYANKSNHPHHYLRYSFNGVFPNTGMYFDDDPDPIRWRQIARDMNIRLEDKKTTGSNIVLCLQRDGGWSMGKINVKDWTVNTISQLRKYTDRKIIIRPHPGDKKSVSTYLKDLNKIYDKDKSVVLSSVDRKFDQDLRGAWAVVNHNSSSIVGAIIKGYSAFVTDPTSSQCAEVSNSDLSNIEEPKEFDRQRWLERISMFHWKFSELENGKAWEHMRAYVLQ